MSEPLVLCPTCREGVPDRLYDDHQLHPSHNPMPVFDAKLALTPVSRTRPLGRRMVLAGFDLSQVEARVELMLAAGATEVHGTDVGKECVRLATAHPQDFDIHTYVAAIALDKPESEITDVKGGDQPSERQIGKTTGHGWMRGMGADTMSNNFLKKGFVVTPETCAKRIARIDAKLPAIRGGFFPDVERQTMRFRGLATVWGAIWRCDWQSLGPELYGSAYSYQPQRDCVDTLNQAGLFPLRAEIMQRLALTRANPALPWDRIPRAHVHGHDALLLSVFPDDVYPLFHYVENTLGRTSRRYYAGTLCTPVTYQVGSAWGGKGLVKEWKVLPSEQECRDAAWAFVEGA